VLSVVRFSGQLPLFLSMPRRIFAIVGFLAAASVVSFLLSPKLRLQTTASEQDGTCSLAEAFQSEEQANQEEVGQSSPANPTHNSGEVVQSEEQVNQESDQSNPADPTMGTPDKELNSQEKKEILQKWSHLNNDTLSALTNMLNTRNDKIRKYTSTVFFLSEPAVLTSLLSSKKVQK